MESELLTFEVRFLKAQLSAREAEHELSVAQLRSQLEEFERRLGESEHSAAQLRNRLAEAERAEQDRGSAGHGISFARGTKVPRYVRIRS